MTFGGNVDYNGVKEVTEVSGEQTVNRYLKAGWKILTVGTMTTDAREYSGPVIKYSLGWTGEGAAPHF
ncbi:hypothetical protein D3C72_2485130 [compost metagenome]